MVTQQALDREAELDALESHVRAALQHARRLGASDAEVSATTSQGLSVGVRLGEVETLEHMQDRGVSVTVLFGRRKGHASSADLRAESMSAARSTQAAIDSTGESCSMPRSTFRAVA